MNNQDDKTKCKNDGAESILSKVRYPTNQGTGQEIWGKRTMIMEAALLNQRQRKQKTLSRQRQYIWNGSKTKYKCRSWIQRYAEDGPWITGRCYEEVSDRRIEYQWEDDVPKG